MTPPVHCTSSNSANDPRNPLLSLSSPCPKRVIATPIKEVTIELSGNPPSVAIMFDVSNILSALGNEARASKAAAPAQPLAKALRLFTAKGVAKAAASGDIKFPAVYNLPFLESLKTFAVANPSLVFLAPVFGIAEAIVQISTLQ